MPSGSTVIDTQHGAVSAWSPSLAHAAAALVEEPRRRPRPLDLWAAVTWNYTD